MKQPCASLGGSLRTRCGSALRRGELCAVLRPARGERDGAGSGGERAEVGVGCV